MIARLNEIPAKNGVRHHDNDNYKKLGTVRPLDKNDPRNIDHPSHKEKWLVLMREFRSHHGGAGLGTSTWGWGRKMSELKEAVAYARYSSARQSARSIDDQFQLCDKIAKQNGYKIVKYFKDAAIAGSGTLARDGWQAVMRGATAKDRSGDHRKPIAHVARSRG